MKGRINLLEGKIAGSLTALAIPIMLTSLIQMAYNMTDMLWIGRLGSNAVAAVGSAGMFTWLAMSIATLARVGGQVKVGHSLGAGKPQLAAKYTKNAMQIGIVLSLIYGVVMVLFTPQLIGFFNLTDQSVIGDAITYLAICGGLVVFNTINTIFTGVITATGNSRVPFFATTVGLILNIILDPILIFGIGPFPVMGVAGAAWATVLAQALVTAVFIAYAAKDYHMLRMVKIAEKPDMPYIKEIFKIGLPSALQSAFFTGIAMVIARIIAAWGAAAIAVQKVGSQIESISWMTSEGFSAAINSFVAQNYGAGNLQRAKKGYHVSLGVISIWGVIATCILVFLAAPLFKVFIQEPNVLPLGVDYLVILGFSQFFMCVEIIGAGVFSGFGQTLIPSAINIILTIGRIPLALYLSTTPLGLNGIWWAITISSIIKGIVMFTALHFYLKKKVPSAPKAVQS